MKSSSELFPVSLLRADVLGDLTEDVYLVKHNRDPDRSVQIAVSHLGLRSRGGHSGQPLILLHGSFTNRGFWLSDKGEGLARYLLEQGFDVWLMEQRGHGLSPRNHDYVRNTLERYVLSDIPAVNDFVQEQSGQKPVWIGHSLGGVIISSSVAAGRLHAENSRAMVLLGTQVVRRPWYLWLPLTSLVLRMLVKSKAELDGRKLGIGPENEPAGLVNEYLARHSLFGRWQIRSEKLRLLPAWKQGADLPLLAVAAAADKSDPAKACLRFASLYGGAQKDNLLLGKAEGFSRDYGHVDMVVSKEAATEVWPRIQRWLSQLRQQAGA